MGRLATLSRAVFIFLDCRFSGDYGKGAVHLVGMACSTRRAWGGLLPSPVLSLFFWTLSLTLVRGRPSRWHGPAVPVSRAVFNFLDFVVFRATMVRGPSISLAWACSTRAWGGLLPSPVLSLFFWTLSFFGRLW